jgi:hypothetical protein
MLSRSVSAAERSLKPITLPSNPVDLNVGPRAEALDHPQSAFPCQIRSIAGNHTSRSVRGLMLGAMFGQPFAAPAAPLGNRFVGFQPDHAAPIHGKSEAGKDSIIDTTAQVRFVGSPLRWGQTSLIKLLIFGGRSLILIVVE